MNLARGEALRYRNGKPEIIVPAFSRERPYELVSEPLVGFDENGDAHLLGTDRVSLDWFGGDLQKAVDASDNGNLEILIPPGEHDAGRITVSRPNVHLRGAGEGATLLRYIGSHQGDVVNLVGDGCSVSDLSIGPSTGTGSGRGAVDLQGDDQRVERVTVLAGMPGKGVRAANASAPELVLVRVLDSVEDGIYCETVGALGSTDLRGPLIDRCVVDRRGIASGDLGHAIAIHKAAGASASYAAPRVLGCYTYLPETAAHTRIGIEIWGGCKRPTIIGGASEGGWGGVSLNYADYGSVLGHSIQRPAAVGLEIADSHHSIADTVIECDGVTPLGVQLNNAGGSNGRGNRIGGVLTGFTDKGVHGIEQTSFRVSAELYSAAVGSKGLYAQTCQRVIGDGLEVDVGYACVLLENTPLAVINGLFRGYSQAALHMVGSTAIQFNAHLSGIDEGATSTSSALSGGATLGTIDTSGVLVV